MAVPQKAMVLLAVVAICSAQQQRDGSWVWRSRSAPREQTRSQSLLKRSGTPFSDAFFRRISARSYPKQRYSANIYDVVNTKDQPEEMPPPQREEHSIPSRHASRRPPPSIITPGDYPYPFAAQPVDLGDGTSIGWAPEDTLPLVHTSNSNGHSAGHFKPAGPEEDFDHNHGEEMDERYTTLDRLNNGRSPTDLPNPDTYSEEILGGLHPDEVYYADKDLVIIKGGGFHHPYDIRGSKLGQDIALNSGTRVKPQPIGNELGEETQNRESPTVVRPAKLFSKVPLPFRFVNGNIPTIVKPVDTGRLPYSPTQQTGFTPIQVNQNDYYSSAASQKHFDTVIPKANYGDWSFQTLDDGEDMIAQESSFGPAVASLPPPSHLAVKRSADPKVVHYHYHSIGDKGKPIVNYQVDDKGVLTHGNRLVSGSVVQPQRVNQLGNAIPGVAKQNPEQKDDTRSSGNRVTHSELEDLSGGHQNSLIPTTQIPKRRPSGQANTPTTPTLISLEGDTDVNFLPPLPRVNPLAEGGRPQLTTGVLQRQNPENLSPNQQPRRQPPPQHNQTGGVTQLRPQVMKTIEGNRPVNPESLRFMEPRRRIPSNIRQRSLRPRL